MYGYGARVSLSDMEGKTLKSIDGARTDSDEIIFTAETGERWVMLHEQDCCESVSVEDICGDISDLIGTPVIVAEEREYDGGALEEWDESFTWHQGAQNSITDPEAALHQIQKQETEGANATVRRMARNARETLGGQMYYLFAGELYYPLEGVKDLHGAYPSLDEAVSAAKEKYRGAYHWWHITDANLNIVQEDDN